MMSAVRIAAVLCFVLAGGCAAMTEAPPNGMARPLMVDPSLAGRNEDRAVVSEPPRSEAKEGANVASTPPPAPPQSVMPGDEASRREPVAGAPALPSKNQSRAKPAVLPGKATAKVPASAPAIEQPKKIGDPPPVAKKPEPPLDVAALKARLRDTNAIGVFTKLALKNQVDDLLQQFRAHYLSGQKASVASLRQSYDMLVLKVLALLQDSDPSLAKAISGSREAIWGILADPKKFNSAI